MSVTIKTNNQFREILNFSELSEKDQEIARKEFDYMDNVEDEFTGFKYKDQLYSFDTFMIENFPEDSPFYGWDSAFGFGYWNGILIKFSDCGDMVKVAYFYQ